MNNKNIIFNHTLEQYNKKYRNRRHRLLKYTKKQVEDFDKEYGHYIFNNKTYNLEHDHYLLKDKKWWFTKEDECYHEIPKPIRFAWFRNLNTGVQIATCALLAGGVAAIGASIGIIEHNKYEATLVVIDKGNTPEGVSFNIDAPKTTDIGNISYKINITTSDSYKPIIEGGKPELVDVSVKKGKKELEKFIDFTFNSATGEVIIKKEAEEKYYGKTVITPTIKTISHTDQQQTWMEAYKPYNDKFQCKDSTPMKYDIKDINVQGLFKNKNKKFVEAKLSNVFPLQYNNSGDSTSLQRNCYLYFQDPENPNDIYGKEIAGGKYSHSRIKTEIFDVLEGQNYKIDYIIGENYVKFDAYLDNVLDISTTINENGYITNSYGLSSDAASQLIIEFKGNPSINQNSREYFIGKATKNPVGTSIYPFNYNSITKSTEPIYFEQNSEYIFLVRTYSDSENMYGLNSLLLSGQQSFGYDENSLSVSIDGETLTSDKYDAYVNGVSFKKAITESGKYIMYKMKWTGQSKYINTICYGSAIPL